MSKEITPITESTKVEIVSLVDWNLYFRNYTKPGDTVIEPAPEKSKITYGELEYHVSKKNKFFVGTDGHGSHAHIVIKDDAIRRELLGEESDNAVLLTLEAVKELMAINNKDKFKERVRELAVTDAEKTMLNRHITNNGGEDLAAWKLDAIEDATIDKKLNEWLNTPQTRTTFIN
jgi:hypothetical protein